MNNKELSDADLRTMHHERHKLLGKMAVQREAIRMLLLDYIRRHVATNGQSFPVLTKAGVKDDPDYPAKRQDVIEVLQRECDELDKEGLANMRYNPRREYNPR